MSSAAAAASAAIAPTGARAALERDELARHAETAAAAAHTIRSRARFEAIRLKAS